MCAVDGELACYVCGRPYGNGERLLIGDTVHGSKVVFVDAPCFEQIRSIRRSRGGSMFEAMLSLSHRLAVAVLGEKAVVSGGK